MALGKCSESSNKLCAQGKRKWLTSLVSDVHPLCSQKKANSDKPRFLLHCQWMSEREN